jgi:hypothetical protein
VKRAQNSRSNSSSSSASEVLRVTACERSTQRSLSAERNRVWIESR